MKMTVRKGDTRIFALCFGMSENSFFYSVGDVVDLAVNLERNEYMGNVRISVYVRNIRPSGSDDIEVLEGLRLFDRVMLGVKLTSEQAKAAFPGRELCAQVYKQIKVKGSWTQNQREKIKEGSKIILESTSFSLQQFIRQGRIHLYRQNYSLYSSQEKQDILF